jgi:ABC-2 type transport system ATP-binding protein
VRIDGKDIEDHAREIQRSLGYLPENLPVYPEMTIAEYLDYAAHLKGLRGNDKLRAIRRSVEATELGARYFDPIGQLSRGFKQRVGVAQAILGEPRLLILDEPGNGLDPEQNEHMRTLIRDLARRATVILSTHIMQEVEALCDRVLVLAGGHLALDAAMDSLRDSRHLLLTCSDEGERLHGLIENLPGVRTVQELASPGDGRRALRLALTDDADMDSVSAAAGQALMQAGARLYRLQPEQRDLERVFRDAVQTAGGRHAA